MINMDENSKKIHGPGKNSSFGKNVLPVSSSESVPVDGPSKMVSIGVTKFDLIFEKFLYGPLFHVIRRAHPTLWDFEVWKTQQFWRLVMVLNRFLGAKYYFMPICSKCCLFLCDTFEHFHIDWNSQEKLFNYCGLPIYPGKSSDNYLILT